VIITPLSVQVGPTVGKKIVTVCIIDTTEAILAQKHFYPQKNLTQ